MRKITNAGKKKKKKLQKVMSTDLIQISRLETRKKSVANNKVTENLIAEKEMKDQNEIPSYKVNLCSAYPSRSGVKKYAITASQRRFQTTF